MNKFLGSVTIIVLFTCCSGRFDSIRNTDYIGIQPFGDIETKNLCLIQGALEKVYNKKVVVLRTIDLPKSAFTNIKSPRYRADSLIRHLGKVKNDSIDIVLGITAKDISTTKKDALGNIKQPTTTYQDWGIFGLGFCPGSSCIVSTFRIKNCIEKIFATRLTKISVHEIGHNFGLPHCPDKNCVMTDACESIKTVDNVKMALCDQCRSQIN